MITVFFFNDPATTEIYTLSLHDALPISFLLVATVVVTIASYWHTHIRARSPGRTFLYAQAIYDVALITAVVHITGRSEEHTSELQSQSNLVCRLLLETKKPDL